VRKVLQWQSVRPTKKTIADKTEEETTNQLRSSPVIKVKDLYYYYDEAKPIFKKLSLTVASGGQLGLVGPSGCGKSTLLLLLTGIITPRAGKITYHFDDLEVSPTQLKIGYVGAEPFLVMGSLLENLLYGWKGPLPTKEEIKKSLLQVSMGEYANKLEMSIGEGGEGLSAGQKQRVCLARALLRKPSLLVLDEATANLDRATEAGIMQVLKNQKGKMTQIIVSHRKETLVHADVILDLKSKK
jgi:ABC-type bacteriocin/lantibiotic exporter with double-glycine peptidase domain